MNGKRSLILIFGTLAILGVVLLVTNLLTRQKTAPEEPSHAQVVVPSDKEEETKPNTAQFRTSTYQWQAQKQYEVEVSFDTQPTPYPTAFTLQLLYDPKILRVDEVSLGNLWTGANILQNKVDNEKGEVIFSAGQDFQDQVTNQLLLATLKVTVVNTDPKITQATIEIGPESGTASVGVDHLIDLEIPPIILNLEK